MPNWKVKIPRDKKYLLWLATLPCCVCGTHLEGQIVGHHTTTGGTGIKGGDYEAVPLCFCHHNEMDNKRKDAIPNLKAIIEKLNANYAKENNK